MCGRYTLASDAEAVANELDLGDVPALTPRWNIAPTQDVPVVRFDAPAGRRVLAFARWGLVPPRAADPRVGARLINARAETLAERAAFRDAFRARRCLVVADGFYEWRRPEGGAKGPTEPWYFHRSDGRPFAFAGLWERGRARDGAWLESCAIVTTGANARLRPVHDRMPAILAREDHARWLDPGSRDLRRLSPLLRPAPEDALVGHRVGPHVNDPRNDDPECVARA